MGTICTSCKKSTLKIAPTVGKLIDQSDIDANTRLSSKFQLGVQDHYEFLKILGHGHFGVVRKARSIYGRFDSYVAIKSISKQKVVNDYENLRREIEIIKTMDHPHIIEFYETFEDERYIHIVMEYCRGGDLCEYLIKNSVFSEIKAANLFEKIFRAVSYLHNNQIVHRDIKPDNILIVNSDQDLNIKITDFGLSKKFGSPFQKMNTAVGSPLYVAPEVIRKNFGKECDVWSIGVMLYIILSGHPPFKGKTIKEVFQNILRCEYDFSGKYWSKISRDAKDLISNILVVVPEERYTIQQCLQHPWLRRFNDKTTSGKLSTSAINSLKNFHIPKKLCQIAMRIMIKNFNSKEIQELKVNYNQRMFEELDKNNTGFITTQEFTKEIQNYCTGITDSEVKKIQFYIDNQCQGLLNYSNFIFATLERKSYMDEQRIFEVFKFFDRENSGTIGVHEVREAMEQMGINTTIDEVISIFNEVVKKGTADIGFEDFKAILLHGPETKELVNNQNL